MGWLFLLCLPVFAYLLAVSFQLGRYDQWDETQKGRGARPNLSIIGYHNKRKGDR
jgi:hypothetical protein